MKKSVNNFLESEVERTIKYIIGNNLGFGMKHHAKQTYEGKYIKNQGEAFDFTIFYKSEILNFDCKQSHLEKYLIRDKDIKQALNLIKIQRLNDNLYNCFFLFYFIKEKKLGIINATRFLQIKQERNFIQSSDLTLIKDLKFLVKV